MSAEQTDRQGQGLEAMRTWNAIVVDAMHREELKHVPSLSGIRGRLVLLDEGTLDSWDAVGDSFKLLMM